MRIRMLVAAGLIAGCFGSAALAQQGDTLVLPMQYVGESDTLYNMALQQQGLAAQFVVTPTEMAQKHGPVVADTGGVNLQTVQGAISTSYTQTAAVKPLAAVAGANFEGPGVGMPGFVLTGAPPDTTMAVGPSHIIAWVNSMFAIMDKTGTVLQPGGVPVNGNTLFTGVGGLCETTNRGDPILQYDRAADRWVMSQFAFGVVGGAPVAPYSQCIAVSTTGNPLGTPPLGGKTTHLPLQLRLDHQHPRLPGCHGRFTRLHRASLRRDQGGQF